MKRITLIFVIILMICFQIDFSYASGNYARITQSCYLYKTSTITNSIDDIVCILEPTYFCQILADYNDSMYKVSYAGVTGYVQKTKVKQVMDTPKVPYPSGVKITTTLKCYLRNSPIISSENVICTVPKDTSNISYIAKTIGEVDMDLYGNTWFLCSYNNVTGYIYSGYTSGIDTIMPNVETVSYLEPVDKGRILPIPATYCIILLLIILLPTSLIFYFLYKPYKIK